MSATPSVSSQVARRRPVMRRVEAEEDESLLDFIPDEDDGKSPIQAKRSQHLTKFGKKDRRFLGQRDIPPEETVVNPNYVHPKTGGVIGETHITQLGKPDMRFRENRNRPQEEVLADWAENVYEQFGRQRH